MSKTLKSILSGSIWGITSKVIDAFAKFVTIPMLIGYYGKSDYGLIALAFSLNTYLRLMDLGMNIGSIRFFSIWFEKKEDKKIIEVAQSSIMFYGIIGIVNSLIFILVGHFSHKFYRFEDGQYETFKWMMYILAGSTVFNWTSYVVIQLLTAREYLVSINKAIIISSALNFTAAYLAIQLNLSLSVYFALYILSTVIVIPLNLWKLRDVGIPLKKLVYPKWNYSSFKEVLNYSFAIFIISIFQFSADNFRPIILGAYSQKGVSVLTDYRIVQTMAILVASFGAIFLQVLLPISSKSMAQGDIKKSEMIIYTGTKYISLFLSFVVFIICINSKLILNLYVGPGYLYLAPWLMLWLLTVLISMHGSSVSSMIYSTGKTKPLIYLSIVGCFVTLIITIVLTPTLNVGAPILGYFIYVLLHTVFTYLYYIPLVLKMNSSKLFFQSFLPAFLIGVTSLMIGHYISLFLNLKCSDFIAILLNSVYYTAIFLILSSVFIFKIYGISSLKDRISLINLKRG